MFVFNSALKGLDDTSKSKSKAAARWIVVKVSHLNNASSYILVLCRLICTWHWISKFHNVFSVIDKKEALSVGITLCTGCQL